MNKGKKKKKKKKKERKKEGRKEGIWLGVVLSLENVIAASSAGSHRRRQGGTWLARASYYEGHRGSSAWLDRNERVYIGRRERHRGASMSVFYLFFFFIISPLLFALSRSAIYHALFFLLFRIFILCIFSFFFSSFFLSSSFFFFFFFIFFRFDLIPHLPSLSFLLSSLRCFRRGPGIRA